MCQWARKDFIRLSHKSDISHQLLSFAFHRFNYNCRHHDICIRRPGKVIWATFEQLAKDIDLRLSIMRLRTARAQEAVKICIIKEDSSVGTHPEVCKANRCLIYCTEATQLEQDSLWTFLTDRTMEITQTYLLLKSALKVNKPRSERKKVTLRPSLRLALADLPRDVG